MKIRTPAPLTLAAIGLLTLSPFAAQRAFAHGNERHASAPAAKTNITVKGEVIDMGCYLGHGAKGAAHIKCAQMCVNKGMPIGLLTGDGTLYLLTMDHGDAKPFDEARAKVGTVITVTGDEHDGGGMKALEVKKVAA